MFDFDEALKLVPKQTVLCVGDLMLMISSTAR